MMGCCLQILWAHYDINYLHFINLYLKNILLYVPMSIFLIIFEKDAKRRAEKDIVVIKQELRGTHKTNLLR